MNFNTKGFLLIELMGGLLLLSICITVLMSYYTHITATITRSYTLQKNIMVIISLLEKVDTSKKSFQKQYSIDSYTYHVDTTPDKQYKNFLHITVTVYDKEKKIDTWFFGSKNTSCHLKDLAL